MLVVVESIATVVLLGIQATGESAPPSSLAGNFQKAKSKGKQVQRICFHRGEDRLCRGSIRVRLFSLSIMLVSENSRSKQ
ncbi:hypothetical protein V6N13_075239 [Hibiscus sabdariffa]